MIRGALIAVAVGGGLFALSQVLAPSQAHAETIFHSSVSPQSGSDAVQPPAEKSLLGPVLGGLGSTLGDVTGVVDGVVGVTGHTVDAVTKPVTGTVSGVLSATVNVLPAPVAAPVKQVTSPVLGTVTNVTGAVTSSVTQVAAAKPVSGLVGAVSGTVDGVVADVDRVPVVGDVVGRLVGDAPVSGLLSPAAVGLDATVGSLASTVDETVSGATGDLASGGAGDATLPAFPGTDVSGGFAGVDVAGGDAAVITDSIDSGVGADASVPASAGDAAAVDSVEVPFGPMSGSSVASRAIDGASATAVAFAAPVALPDGSAPLGSPFAPQASDSGVASSGNGGTSAGCSGGSGQGAAAGVLGFFDFPAAVAGLSSLVDGDVLPASPVFESDSTPD